MKSYAEMTTMERIKNSLIGFGVIALVVTACFSKLVRDGETASAEKAARITKALEYLPLKPEVAGFTVTSGNHVWVAFNARRRADLPDDFAQTFLWAALHADEALGKANIGGVYVYLLANPDDLDDALGGDVRLFCSAWIRGGLIEREDCR